MGRDLRWCGKHSGPGHFADCTLPVNDAAQGGAATLATTHVAGARNYAMPATLTIAQDAEAVACLPGPGAE